MLLGHLEDTVKQFPLVKCDDVESLDAADACSVSCLATHGIDEVTNTESLSSESLLTHRRQASLGTQFSRLQIRPLTLVNVVDLRT